MTILFYLNEVEGGGQTAFPVANNDTADLQVGNFIFSLFMTARRQLAVLGVTIVM